MKIKLVTDSSANLVTLPDVAFSSVPLKVLVGSREFSDDSRADVPEMLQALKAHKGPTSTACPSVQDWLDAFGDAEIVYGAAITSALSGCYNAAAIAATEYMEKHPGRKVFLLDSLTTGPELALIMEKFRELSLAGLPFEAVCEQVRAYAAGTRLMFCLASLDNFAKNGRVSPAVAAAVGILGIRVVGKASDTGTLEPMHKVRGEKKAIQRLIKTILESGYRGGKLRIAHTRNPEAAKDLQGQMQALYPDADITVCENRALCAYYAETGGILIGYEV